MARERIPLPGLYYSHQREVVRRKGLLVPVTEVTPPEAGETVETAARALSHRGRHDLHLPRAQRRSNAADIVAETLTVTVSERGATRMDDRTSDASMERRKKEGYF
jgi:sulfate adenylyltransferase subunit 2